LGAAAWLGLLARAALGARSQSRNSLSTRNLGGWARPHQQSCRGCCNIRLRSHGVAGEFAAMGGATVLLERTRTICIGYGLIAGMGRSWRRNLSRTSGCSRGDRDAWL